MRKRNRVVMDMSPESAAALRMWAKENRVTIKDAAGAMYDHIENEAREAAELWPSWATQCLKMIRAHSGYDGYDDQYDGVDMPVELADLLEMMVKDAEDLGERLVERNEIIRQLTCMTAWDHVREAVGKAPFLTGVLFGVPPGCVAVAVAVAMGVL